MVETQSLSFIGDHMVTRKTSELRNQLYTIGLGSGLGFRRARGGGGRVGISLGTGQINPRETIESLLSNLGDQLVS